MLKQEEGLMATSQKSGRKSIVCFIEAKYGSLRIYESAHAVHPRQLFRTGGFVIRIFARIRIR